MKQLDEATALNLQSQRDKLERFINKHAPFWECNKTCPPAANDVEHDIPVKPDARPIFVITQMVNPTKEEALQKLIKEMKDNGLVESSSSEWSLPVVLIRKPDNTWRFCLDFRKLNEQSYPMKFPIPKD